MKGYFKKIWSKIKKLFKQGLTPIQLAMTITMAVLVSLFPIFGITTIVLTAIALPMRLNLPIMIVLSYIIEPLKILLLIPFINIGAYLFGAEHTLLSFSAIKESLSIDVVVTLKDLSYELLCGTVGWAIIVLPLSVLLYFLLKVLITAIFKFKGISTGSNKTS